MRTDYTVVCSHCGTEISDEFLPLDCSCGKPALLKSKYKKTKIEIGPDFDGIYKYSDWLPVQRRLKGSGAPVTFKSVKLGKKLGLSNLYITFNGYWPERGVSMATGTFKECEAYSVCARIPEDHQEVLVVASAGNTARAFAHVCSDNRIPLVVVIPEQNKDAMWFDRELHPCVKIVAAGGDSDYYDAIRLSGLISEGEGYIAEGGAKNIARRDGMATTVLSAVEVIGRIPDYYFQAVGSGTGAIAAWEANRRLIADGRFGDTKMKLMVSQNEPFLLIHDSWNEGTRNLVQLETETALRQIHQIKAKVLSNRNPPYGIIGGLYDALTDNGGDVLTADNREVAAACTVFEEAEGIDISPEAGVAFASLMKAVGNGSVDRDAVIMLNITGGGMERLKTERKMVFAEPLTVIPKEMISREKFQKMFASLYKLEGV